MAISRAQRRLQGCRQVSQLRVRVDRYDQDVYQASVGPFHHAPTANGVVVAPVVSSRRRLVNENYQGDGRHSCYQGQIGIRLSNYAVFQGRVDYVIKQYLVHFPGERGRCPISEGDYVSQHAARSPVPLCFGAGQGPFFRKRFNGVVYWTTARRRHYRGSHRGSDCVTYLSCDRAVVLFLDCFC